MAGKVLHRKFFVLGIYQTITYFPHIPREVYFSFRSLRHCDIFILCQYRFAQFSRNYKLAFVFVFTDLIENFFCFLGGGGVLYLKLISTRVHVYLIGGEDIARYCHLVSEILCHDTTVPHASCHLVYVCAGKRMCHEKRIS